MANATCRISLGFAPRPTSSRETTRPAPRLAMPDTRSERRGGQNSVVLRFLLILECRLSLEQGLYNLNSGSRDPVAGSISALLERDPQGKLQDSWHVGARRI